MVPFESATASPPVRSMSSRGLQHFTIALGGESDVGKTSVFNHLRDTPLPGRREYKKLATQATDCCKFSFVTDLAEIRVTLWDTAGLEKFRSMTHSYFHQLSALILVHSTKKERSLEGIERWIAQVDEAYPPVLCVLTNIVDPGDPEEQRIIERVPHFLSHKSIDSRLCFNICACTGKVEAEGQTAVVDACNTLLDRLIKKQLEGSVSYGASGSLRLEPAASGSMVTRMSEVGVSRVTLLHGSEDNEDNDGTGTPIQRRQRHRCWKC